MMRKFALALLAAAPIWAQTNGPIQFNRDILPILSENCFACHGPDPAHRISNLRFDLEEPAKAALRGNNRFAVIPGNAEASELIQRVTSTGSNHMPPAPRPSLTPQQIDLLKAWINQGASWQKHWSFNAPVRPAVPATRDTQWTRNAIDNFVLARLESEGMKHSDEAKRTALIRRVTFDLTGLPPTPAEVTAFVNDTRRDAYERVVDRLLASPRFGERMATPWLDAARYADSNGYQIDGERRMWPWRDWVVRAFNSNKPFDQFVVEQLAGDLLPNATTDQKIATGFNRNHRGNSEGGIIPEEYAAEYVADRVDTTATVFLGLTVGCARCHDHRFDPISQKEYYQLFSFFNNVPESGKARRAGNSPPFIKAPNADQLTRLAQMDRDIQQAQAAYNAQRTTQQSQQAAWERTLRGPAVRGGPNSGLTYQLPQDPKFTTTPYGAGMVLDGTSFFNAGDVARFRTYGYLDDHPLANEHQDDAFSFAAWIYPTAPTGAIASRAQDQTEPIGYGLYLKDSKVAVYDVTKWVDEGIRIESEKSITLNQWHHVAATYNGSRTAAGMHIYVDGVEQKFIIELDDMNNAPMLTFTREPFRVGGGGGAENRFKGTLADVRVYNRPLTPAEAALMAAPASIQDIAAKPVGIRTPAEAAKIELYFLETAATGAVRSTREHLLNLQALRTEFYEDIPTTMVMEEMATPRESFLLKRGSYDQPGDRVYPVLPAILPPMPAGLPANRLGLAKWLTSPDHPLLARVTVNRFWQQYFGTGLVKTSEDFGSQGEAPSHPELLDWLATEFIQSGWDIKALQRLIVTSAAYRQASATTDELTARDPENRLLARGPVLRLTAEMVRDQALAVSGLLVDKAGGAPVKPYQPEGLWAEVAKEEYVQDHGENLYRRSLYTFFRRAVPPPTMANFDVGVRETCIVRPASTNTPLQALDLMNNVTYLEAARLMGQRMMLEGGTVAADRIAWGFQLATAHRPDAKETDILNNFFRQQLDQFQTSPQAADKFLTQGESPRAPGLRAPELAAYASVASLILNLDETVTKQ